MNGLDLFLIAICIVLVLMPPRMDPAIRWKERNLDRRNREPFGCTCQGGLNQPSGCQLRANDCPIHGLDEDAG